MPAEGKAVQLRDRQQAEPACAVKAGRGMCWRARRGRLLPPFPRLPRNRHTDGSQWPKQPGTPLAACAPVDGDGLGSIVLTTQGNVAFALPGH
jgi:hypothetical protein